MVILMVEMMSMVMDVVQVVGMDGYGQSWLWMDKDGGGEGQVTTDDG